MAVVEMKKLSLIGMKQNKEAILQTLLELGVCEVSALDDSSLSEEVKSKLHSDEELQEITSIEQEVAMLSTVLDLLELISPEKQSLFSQKRWVTEKDIDNLMLKKDDLLLRVRDLFEKNERLSSMKIEKNKKHNQIASLTPWKSCDIPLERISTKTTQILLGVLPANADEKAFEQELQEVVVECTSKVLHMDADQTYVQVIFSNQKADEVATVSKKYGFTKVSFKGMEGTIEENIQRIQNEITAIGQKQEDVQKQILEQKSVRKSFETLHDALLMNLEKKKAQGRLRRTRDTFLLNGWVPAQTQKLLEESVGKKFDCILQFQEPTDDDQVPVLLQNNGLANATEMITNMYSLPDRKEIDPNKITGPFFVLFFGLMLSDGGYGLLMILATLFLLKKMGKDDGSRKFVKLMFYAGLSTVFWGALFGGWFGIKALAEKPIWLNPVEEPVEMLRWSLVFGVFHLFVGIGVRAANLIRKREYMNVLWDVVTWYIFFVGFVLFALPYVPNVDPASVVDLVALGKKLFLIGAILLVLTQGRHNKGIVMKFVGGLTSLYDIVSFMSDVLSYSRLLALGLATSVIASIVNEMGAMFGTSGIKMVLFIVVLVVGHLFNFAINALGAFVHSSRLQYIEFFSKFYKGGGVAFEPLQMRTKYIQLKSK